MLMFMGCVVVPICSASYVLCSVVSSVKCMLFYLV